MPIEAAHYCDLALHAHLSVHTFRPSLLPPFHRLYTIARARF